MQNLNSIQVLQVLAPRLDHFLKPKLLLIFIIFQDWLHPHEKPYILQVFRYRSRHGFSGLFPLPSWLQLSWSCDKYTEVAKWKRELDTKCQLDIFYYTITTYTCTHTHTHIHPHSGTYEYAQKQTFVLVSARHPHPQTHTQTNNIFGHSTHKPQSSYFLWSSPAHILIIGLGPKLWLFSPKNVSKARKYFTSLARFRL